MGNVSSCISGGSSSSSNSSSRRGGVLRSPDVELSNGSGRVAREHLEDTKIQEDIVEIITEYGPGTCKVTPIDRARAGWVTSAPASALLALPSACGRGTGGEDALESPCLPSDSRRLYGVHCALTWGRVGRRVVRRGSGQGGGRGVGVAGARTE